MFWRENASSNAVLFDALKPDFFNRALLALVECGAPCNQGLMRIRAGYEISYGAAADPNDFDAERFSHTFPICSAWIASGSIEYPRQYLSR
jgi:hypothetical protein